MCVSLHFRRHFLLSSGKLALVVSVGHIPSNLMLSRIRLRSWFLYPAKMFKICPVKKSSLVIHSPYWGIPRCGGCCVGAVASAGSATFNSSCFYSFSYPCLSSSPSFYLFFRHVVMFVQLRVDPRQNVDFAEMRTNLQDSRVKLRRNKFVPPSSESRN